MWPDDNFGNFIWVLAVDGTHCWIQEPQQPTWSQYSDYYSHKYAKTGLNYELGILNMTGPHQAVYNNVSVFTGKGFKEKLRTTGKRGIEDGGYCGHPKQLSTKNSQNSKEATKFKSCTLKCHKKCDGYTKTFDCLSGCFRHSVD
jgi:hypothetical protein